MSTSRRPAFSGPSKKISSWVRPGVCEVRARPLRPVSALISEDLPTLERPAKAISLTVGGGKLESIEAAVAKSHGRRKRSSPCLSAVSSVTLSIFTRCFLFLPFAVTANERDFLVTGFTQD